jgi:hypothetical protein
VRFLFAVLVGLTIGLAFLVLLLFTIWLEI